MKLKLLGGFGRVCVSPYPDLSDESSKDPTDEMGFSPMDPGAFISNVRISNAFAAQNKIESIEGEALGDFLIKDFSEVQEILAKHYSINFEDTLVSLQQAFQGLIKHSRIPKHSDSQFQLFAVDFMLTTRGKLYILEANAFPSFVEGNPKKDRIYRRVLRGMARTIKRKILRTRRVLSKMVHEERFNETEAISDVAHFDL